MRRFVLRDGIVTVGRSFLRIFLGQNARPIHSSSTPADSQLIALKIVASARSMAFSAALSERLPDPFRSGTQVSDQRARDLETENLPLANQRCDNHLLLIEFRPNDLASPRIARLTDDLLPKISN